jgi:hypothetical protein
VSRTVTKVRSTQSFFNDTTPFGSVRLMYSFPPFHLIKRVLVVSIWQSQQNRGIAMVFLSFAEHFLSVNLFTMHANK